MKYVFEKFFKSKEMLRNMSQVIKLFAGYRCKVKSHNHGISRIQLEFEIFQVYNWPNLLKISQEIWPTLLWFKENWKKDALVKHYCSILANIARPVLGWFSASNESLLSQY